MNDSELIQPRKNITRNLLITIVIAATITGIVIAITIITINTRTDDGGNGG